MSVEDGKFVVIDGGDSSGKEVQSKRLVEVLRLMGHSVEFLDFPQYNQFFGQIVGRYLRGDFGLVRDVHPVLSSIPYALDRASMRDKIKRWKDEGHIIVANRYTAANFAFMSAKLPGPERQGFIEWEEELEYGRLGVVKEDLVIFLHVPAKKGQELTYKKDEKPYMKGRGRGDIHERDLEYLETVIEQYKWLSQNREHWVMIECMRDDSNLRPIEEIHNEIIHTLKERGILKGEQS